MTWPFVGRTGEAVAEEAAGGGEDVSLLEAVSEGLGETVDVVVVVVLVEVASVVELADEAENTQFE